MTYGAHQEQVAEALHALIVSDEPLSPAESITTVECRHQVIAAARERVTFLGGSWEPLRSRDPSVLTVARQPLRALSSVLDGLPADAGGNIAPTDLLPGPPAHAAATSSDRWRCVARNMMLGNHELSAATNKPWVNESASLWHLTGELAAAVEAVVLLDQRLVDRGLLPGVTPSTRTTQRLVLGDVARMARWFGSDRAADLSYASPLSQLGLYDGPRIHLVRRVEDLATAQRTLAALLRYRKNDPVPSAGLRAARMICVGQSRMAHAFVAWADDSDVGDQLAEQFRRRLPAFKALHASTVRLVEAAPIRSPLVLAQQAEMSTQLHRFESRPPTTDVLIDLNEASHDVTVAVGRTLRREGMTRRTLLTLDEDGIGLPRPRAITSTREPFQVACKMLADDPVPLRSTKVPSTSVFRDDLRATLDREPSPSYPRLRSVSADPPRRPPARRTSPLER